MNVCRRIDLDSVTDVRCPEWLVTNKLGGYASGTVAGPPARSYHALLIAALPAPIGRMVMLQVLRESLVLADGSEVGLFTRAGERSVLHDFHLENGLPVWQYRCGALVLEKRVFMPQAQNTVHVAWRLIEGAKALLRLRPYVKFRPLTRGVDMPLEAPYTLVIRHDRYELHGSAELPPLRMCVPHRAAVFTAERATPELFHFELEQERGYASDGTLWCPGIFAIEIAPHTPVTFTASTEPWDTLTAHGAEEALLHEQDRRRRLLGRAVPAARTGLAAELVLAADAFVITPAASRQNELPRARAMDDDVRSVIAGYHWFTDWGRDTMISLEGLTLVTGRHEEAGFILRTFARYVRDGLIPNLFPEGEKEGLYHTADATLWFFHALARYHEITRDDATLRSILPKLVDIFAHHVHGTRFGIRVDPADGLLTQGAPGYQLTWMDAKVGDWVITPRRGKAVELNALWYNAVRLLEGWLRDAGEHGVANDVQAQAIACYESFNRRFWYARGGYLYDVVDGESGDDPALRPNQILALSLPHAVLEPARWASVMDAVSRELLTPVGLRTLAPGEPHYVPHYDGDVRARDAAYHQGTVWPWLIGPYIDAWLKMHGNEREAAQRLLAGFDGHLSEAGVGYVSEIFNAAPPFRPRGCIAQAWSVAEVLRALVTVRQRYHRG